MNLLKEIYEELDAGCHQSWECGGASVRLIYWGGIIAWPVLVILIADFLINR